MKTNVVTVAESATGSGEYNKFYRYTWRTCTNSLPMHVLQMINRITEGRKWGWSFLPHENIDYQQPNWYVNQTLIMSFENKDDLIQSKLEVAHLL